MFPALPCGSYRDDCGLCWGGVPIFGSTAMFGAATSDAQGVAITLVQRRGCLVRILLSNQLVSPAIFLGETRFGRLQ